jgi:hypothetical protein
MIICYTRVCSLVVPLIFLPQAPIPVLLTFRPVHGWQARMASRQNCHPFSTPRATLSGLSNFNSQVSTTKALFALSPAKSAHTQNTPATPAESALPFLLDLKPTRINTYEKLFSGGPTAANVSCAGAPFVALCATSGSPVCNTTWHSVCKKTTCRAAASLRGETIFGCFSLQYVAVGLCVARSAE